MDARATRTAARQHGLVGRRQLFAAGLSRHHVDELVRSARLERVSRGVYLVAGAPMTLAAEMMAAAIRCGPGAVIVGERMLAAVGVIGAHRDGPFEVLTRPGRVVTGVPWSRRQAAPPVDDHRTIVDGIPSVTPARNLLEVAAGCDERVLARLVDGCRWTGKLPAAVALAGSLPHHPGAQRLLASGLVDSGACESGEERRLARLLVDLGAERQVWVAPTMRVDFLVRDAGLVIERDPDATHGGPVGRARTQLRRASLAELGLHLEPVTDDDMQHPDALRRHLTALANALRTARRPSSRS